MAVSLKKFREIFLQVLYSRDLNKHSDPRVFSSMLDQWIVPRKILHQVFAKVDALFKEIERIDSLIAQFSNGYEFKRISRVERNVLRLAVFEVVFEREVPPKVSLSEAVRLSQKFGTPEGGSFVNGVLDAIFQSRDLSCSSEIALNLLNH